MTACHVCQRAARGFGFHKPPSAPRHYCSMEHLKMRDPNKQEQDALKNAGAMAGEYLDSIGKTDLATLTVEEWNTFIECAVTGFVEHLSE